uniref:Uncharacterized protein n=1 Tax=viral metagenome TaxID=1070528 RepID=A0A6C0HEF3_9ZZZZ
MYIYILTVHSNIYIYILKIKNINKHGYSSGLKYKYFNALTFQAKIDK